MHPEATLERAMAALPASAPQSGSRVYLERTGEPILSQSFRNPTVIAVGPEGGLEDSEKTTLAAAGFVAVSLGQTILRFETAAIAALALARVALAPPSSHAD
jgi:16S rRNA (uracil1498-N3)-methyltransferase